MMEHCCILLLGPVACGGFRIQPTFALVRVVRGDLSWDINCPIPPAHCMLGLLACSEAYKFWTVGHWVVLVQVIYCSKGR